MPEIKWNMFLVKMCVHMCVCDCPFWTRLQIRRQQQKFYPLTISRKYVWNLLEENSIKLNVKSAKSKQSSSDSLVYIMWNDVVDLNVLMAVQ